MKKAGIFILGLCFVLTTGVQAHAWFGGKKKEAAPAEETQEVKESAAKQAAAPAVTAPKVDKALEKTLKEKREAVAKKMALLNNSEWAIDMSPAGKGKKEGETVAFKNNQVSMAGFLKKGFAASNFTMTLQEDGSVVWETMQTSEKNGICFWRGELDKSLTTMRGVLSYVIDNKNKVDYTFASTSRRALPTDK